MKAKNIYLLRYQQKGYNDGVALYTTLKEAKNAAITAVQNWKAYKATVFIMEYESINFRYRYTNRIFNYTNDNNK